MIIDDFKGKRVTVMGLGLNGGGVGIARFLSSAGAKVTVTDLKTEEELEPSLAELEGVPGVSFVLGRHCAEDFTETDMVVKNPGVPWDNGYVALALGKNIPVEIDSSLFFKLCKNPIIGVTGTRGKTTTASLIYGMLKTAGRKPVQVGIGQVSVLDKLDGLEADSVVVFELSSWRLSALGHHKLSPRIAVITNIYPDHLNYYESMEEYVADKKNIFLNQSPEDVCVVNYDDEIIRGLLPEIKAETLRFSTQGIVDGAYVENGKIFFKGEYVLEVSDIGIRGGHNIKNVLAAVCVAGSLDIGAEAIRMAVRAFKGVEHRMEFVREVGGVGYFNDTTATSPEGAIAGLDSFSEKIVLIAGGADKNLDMAGFAEAIARKTKAVVFLRGAATDKIIAAMEARDGKREHIVADSMAEAVDCAHSLASAGDVVLLSPGASSFGLFKNEFDRGDKFKKSVRGLR